MNEMMLKHQLATRTKTICFNRKDIEAYGDLLSEKFPHVRFRTWLTHEQRYSKVAPVIPLHQRLADCPAETGGHLNISIQLGDLAGLDLPLRDEQDRHWYEKGSLPSGLLRYNREPQNCCIPRFQSLPLFLERKDFSFVASRDDADGIKMIEMALRLLRKVAWTGLVDFYRFTLSPVAPPKIELREEATKTSIVFGRDAMRWAKEDPERFIGVYTDTYPISNGYRPAP